MSESNTPVELVELAADIVAAYVGNNAVPISDLPVLIADIHKSLISIAMGVQDKPADVLVPAISIRKSLTPDYIVCLEDGKKFKSLKRHLRTRYDMSPDEYRAKWGLPADYPMVAPNYAAARSELAKSMGLGQQRRKTAEKKTAPVPKGGRKAAGG